MTPLRWKQRQAFCRLVQGTIEAWLVSDRAEDQALADEALACLGLDREVAYLRQLLRSEEQRKRAELLATTIIGTLLLLAVCTIYPLSKFPPSFLILLLSIRISLAAHRWRSEYSSLQKAIVFRAARLQRPCDLPILLQGLLMSNSDRDMRLAAMTALNRLLPHVTRHQRAMLDEEQWNFLCRLLGTRMKRPQTGISLAFFQAVIRALGNIRYPAARAVIAGIAARKGETPEMAVLRDTARMSIMVWDNAEAPTNESKQSCALETASEEDLRLHMYGKN